MFGRRIIFVVTNPTKKLIAFGLIITLIFTFLCTIILANHKVKPLDGKSIVLDPGHGGIDGGTHDGFNILEKNVNLAFAKKLRKALVEDNARVDMTRDKDISLDSRNNLSSSRHARDLIQRAIQFNSGKYDIFISIHANSSLNKNAMGPMVLYSSGVPSTELLAECIQARLNTHVKDSLHQDIKHCTVQSSFYILRSANIPGVLVETGFISNQTEKNLLINDSYQTKLAKVVANGIKDYFKAVDEMNVELGTTP